MMERRLLALLLALLCLPAWSVAERIESAGRYSLFSTARNLSRSDLNPGSDVYLHDAERGRLWHLSACRSAGSWTWPATVLTA